MTLDRAHRPLRMKKKLLLAAASFAVTVLLVEVVLRVAFWPYITQIYVLDDRCLFRPRASSGHFFRYIPPNDGPDILVSVDPDGYRGPDREAPDGALRAVVFGDSFVMAEFSEWENTYCARLERELADASGRPAFVVNAGAAGGGPDQYVPRLEDELPKLRPDLVVVAIYAGNDFGDLIRDKMYRVDEKGDVVPNAYTFSDKVRNRFAIGDSSAIYRMVHWLRTTRRMQRGWDSMDSDDPAQQIATAKHLVEGDLEICRGEYREYVELGRNDIRTLLDDHYDSDLALEPDSDSSRYKVKLMEGVLARIAKVVRDAELPLLLVAIPAPNDVIENYTSGIADKEKFPKYRESRLTDEVVRIARELGVPCLDLFGPFRERGAEMYLHAPDIHWNDEGQRVAAKLTRELIERDRLLRR